MKIYFTLRKNFFVLLIDMNLVTKLHSITTSFCYTCALRLKSALLPAIIFFNSFMNKLKGHLCSASILLVRRSYNLWMSSICMYGLTQQIPVNK